MTRFFKILVGVCLALHAGTAGADGMVPETPVLILEEKNGEATMKVRNTDNVPSLLHTVIRSIPEDDEELLVVTPPVARVEPGETQLVRFLLQSKAPLKVERLKRIAFEGIKPQEQYTGPRVTMSVEQNIPAVIRPANLPLEREAWKHLVWTREGDELVVRNPSPYVVRLSGVFMLLPSNESLDLGRHYVLPQTEQRLALPKDMGTQTAVRLRPATLYGFAVPPYEAALTTK